MQKVPMREAWMEINCKVSYDSQTIYVCRSFNHIIQYICTHTVVRNRDTTERQKYERTIRDITNFFVGHK